MLKTERHLLLDHLLHTSDQSWDFYHSRPSAKGLHFGFDDVGVYLSYSIDGVRAYDTQMGHVHPLAAVLFNQRHFPQFVHVVREESSNFLWGKKQTNKNVFNQ